MTFLKKNEQHHQETYLQIQVFSVHPCHAQEFQRKLSPNTSEFQRKTENANVLVPDEKCRIKKSWYSTMTQQVNDYYKE